MQETFLNDSIPSSLLTGGTNFRVYRRDRPERTGGGVAVLIREGIDCSVVEVPPHLEVVALDVRSKSRCFRIICCYKPPNATPIYVTSLIACIISLSSVSSSIPVLLGDFNFPSLGGCLTPSCNLDHLSSSFLATVEQLALVQLNSHASRDGSDNILDLIFCPATHSHLFSPVSCCEPFQGSDHYSLSFTFTFHHTLVTPPAPFRNFRKGRYEEAKVYLSSIDWGLCLQNCSNIDEYYNRILYYLNYAIECFVPMTKLRPQNSLPHFLLRLRRKKHKCFVTRKSEPTRYKEVCKEYEKGLKSHFSHIESNLISSGNIKSFYDYVKRRTKGEEREVEICVDGAPVKDAGTKATHFSTFFSSVFTHDDGSLPSLPVVSPFRLSSVRCTPHLLCEVSKTLKSKLSAGPDKIPSYFLKQVLPSISYPLCVLFTWSFNTGSVPHLFKSSIVRPIWKRKGSKTDISNYRPITLCSSIAKLQEKVVTRLLIAHCTQLGLFSQSQFGFLPNRSLTTQLLLSLKDWSLPSKKPTYIIYLDFQKAFDSVSHPKLMTCLRSFGISGTLLTWIQEYLSGRTQVVSLDGGYSSPAKVTSGIMQGSCLGPVLFVLFVNNLLEGLNRICKCLAYADDVKLYSNDPLEIHSALAFVESWCLTWQLGLSVKKCAVLQIGPGAQVPFLLYNQPLPYVTSMRDLGVIVDEKLSFSLHCLEVAKKARRTIGIILRCFKSGNIGLLKKAYLTYVRPQLESASQVWNSISEKDSNLLESCQRHFTQRLFYKCGKRETSYEERLRFLGIDTLKMRRFKLDLSLCYKIYHNSTFCPQLLVRKTIQRHLQHNNRLQKEITGGKQRSLIFANRVVTTWNSLPDSVIEGPEARFREHVGL